MTRRHQLVTSYRDLDAYKTVSAVLADICLKAGLTAQYTLPNGTVVKQPTKPSRKALLGLIVANPRGFIAWVNATRAAPRQTRRVLEAVVKEETP